MTTQEMFEQLVTEQDINRKRIYECQEVLRRSKVHLQEARQRFEEHEASMVRWLVKNGYLWALRVNWPAIQERNETLRVNFDNEEVKAIKEILDSKKTSKVSHK